MQEVVQTVAEKISSAREAAGALIPPPVTQVRDSARVQTELSDIHHFLKSYDGGQQFNARETQALRDMYALVCLYNQHQKNTAGGT